MPCAGWSAMAEFRMPSLGADMTDGKLLEWRVKPGDAVHRGDVVGTGHQPQPRPRRYLV